MGKWSKRLKRLGKNLKVVAKVAGPVGLTAIFPAGGALAGILKKGQNVKAQLDKVKGIAGAFGVGRFKTNKSYNAESAANEVSPNPPAVFSPQRRSIFKYWGGGE